MKSEKEIYDALNILKHVCEENKGNCSNCILRNGCDGCGIIFDSDGECYEKIEEWNLKDYENPRLILS